MWAQQPGPRDKQKRLKETGWPHWPSDAYWPHVHPCSVWGYACDVSEKTLQKISGQGKRQHEMFWLISFWVHNFHQRGHHHPVKSKNYLAKYLGFVSLFGHTHGPSNLPRALQLSCHGRQTYGGRGGGWWWRCWFSSSSVLASAKGCNPTSICDILHANCMYMISTT